MNAKTPEERISVLEANEKTIFKKLDEHGAQIKDLTRLTIAVETIAVKTDAMTKTLDGIDGRISEIENKPGKKWEKVTEAIIKTAVTVILGGILGALIALIIK